MPPARSARRSGRHPRLRAFLDARLDPAVATGLALTLALIFAIGGGVLLGVLAYLVRTNSFLTGIDNSVAKWGHRHALGDLDARPERRHAARGHLHDHRALRRPRRRETIRERSVWVIPFIVAVMGGEEILTLTVKQLADRVRPTFNPAAATLGPSFPERPLGDSRSLLRHGGASTRSMARSSDARRAHRARGGNRRRGRREPRAARRALAVGRDRRSRARLGLVRSVRNRLRRAHPPLRRRRRDRRAGRGRPAV